MIEGHLKHCYYTVSPSLMCDSPFPASSTTRPSCDHSRHAKAGVEFSRYQEDDQGKDELEALV